MDKALLEAAVRRSAHHRKAVDWQRKMSDHIAYALLVYTGLQIFVTMGALDTNHGSILPYFGLVLLVAAIIPGCRLFEKRWERLAASDAPPERLAPLFTRDRLILWAAAIGLPFLVTGMIKGLLLLF
ncbi:hypothetical protein GRI75_11605 [Altererythrobacter soli]|uniref:Uncharacterized protein n=1 Tax=Croceibacterium soli TaxID=1739690 RepID=A0A6I4UZL9_9SPHN|nr:hypothetical protein [Croceibacterium soli]MXP42285.1 hypothetical protein [Croceibacterium soli]